MQAVIAATVPTCVRNSVKSSSLSINPSFSLHSLYYWTSWSAVRITELIPPVYREKRSLMYTGETSSPVNTEDLQHSDVYMEKQSPPNTERNGPRCREEEAIRYV